MIRNVLRVAAAGLFAGAMMVSVGCEGGGTGSSEKPTIDLTTKKAPPGAPGAPGGPGGHKVETPTKK